METCKQQSEIIMRHLPAVDRFKRCATYGGNRLSVMGVRVGVGQSIGIDENNT